MNEYHVVPGEVGSRVRFVDNGKKIVGTIIAVDKYISVRPDNDSGFILKFNPKDLEYL